MKNVLKLFLLFAVFSSNVFSGQGLNDFILMGPNPFSSSEDRAQRERTQQYLREQQIKLDKIVSEITPEAEDYLKKFKKVLDAPEPLLAKRVIRFIKNLGSEREKIKQCLEFKTYFWEETVLWRFAFLEKVVVTSNFYWLIILIEELSEDSDFYIKQFTQKNYYDDTVLKMTFKNKKYENIVFFLNSLDRSVPREQRSVFFEPEYCSYLEKNDRISEEQKLEIEKQYLNLFENQD